jgi:hypothetical protein
MNPLNPSSSYTKRKRMSISSNNYRRKEIVIKEEEGAKGEKIAISHKIKRNIM